MLDYHAGVEMPFSSSVGYVTVYQEFGQGARDPSFDHGKLDRYKTADAYFYYAVDIGVIAGTPILAQCRGSVVSSRMTANNDTQGPSDGMGNYVTVKCDDGLGHVFYITYLHLNKTSVPTNFIEGQTIAQSGGTGTFDSGGKEHPHLHVTFGTQLINYSGSAGSVVMADGSLYGTAPPNAKPTYANPAGAPAFFTTPYTSPFTQDGYLHYGQRVKSDNSNPGYEVPPTVVGVNSFIARNKSSTMNGWFFGNDSNPSDTVQWWAIYDGTSASNSGYFYAPPGWLQYGGTWWPWYGGKVPPNTIIAVTSQAINQAYFMGGTSFGAQDAISIAAQDSSQWSSWRSFWVTNSGAPAHGEGDGAECLKPSVVANSALAEFENNGFAPSPPNGDRLNPPPAVLHVPKVRQPNCGR